MTGRNMMWAGVQPCPSGMATIAGLIMAPTKPAVSVHPTPVALSIFSGAFADNDARSHGIICIDVHKRVVAIRLSAFPIADRFSFLLRDSCSRLHAINLRTEDLRNNLIILD